jgi:hypothetical protein
VSHFDELPRRDRSHEIEDEALVAFDTRLTESGCFILQASDRKDYGTDCQIEVAADGHAPTWTAPLTLVSVHCYIALNPRAMSKPVKGVRVGAR